MTEAVKEYREESDIFGTFLSESLCEAVGYRLATSRLYERYKGWSSDNGHHPLNSKNGDYFIPEIALLEQTRKPLGKYGRLRRTYLQEHREALFNHLVLSEKLFPHLNEVDEQAQYLLDTMMPQMVKAAGITEQLKATDQMKWVGLMNTVKAQVEEIIFAELVYR